MLDHMIVPSGVLSKFVLVSSAASAAFMAYSVVQCWRVIFNKILRMPLLFEFECRTHAYIY